MNTEDVLGKAKIRRYEHALMDAEKNNILHVLNRELDEAHTHSKIIYYLLTRPERKDKAGSFLVAFLRQIGVPKDYLTQLERYDRFCKSRRKDYRLYYLTINGSKPSEQSVGKLNKDSIHCISFERDILEWLSECMSYVSNDGYKYSFLKQYMGTIKRITGKGKDFSMNGLINDSETAFAVVDLWKEFRKKMADVMLDFLQKMMEYVGDKGGYECVPYDLNDDYYFAARKTYPGFYILLDSVQVEKSIYRFYFCIEITTNLYFGFAFDKLEKNGEEYWIDMKEMQSQDSSFYKKCTARIDALHIRDIKKDEGLWWAYIENAKGEKMNFKDWSESVIELIDEMDIQIEYIGDYLVNQILKRI